MARRESAERQEEEARVCINDALTDDELRAVLVRLEREDEKDTFGLVCKCWLRLQSSERRRLRARAGPAMLRRMANRFSGLVELDLSQSASRSFYPGVTDTDLSVVAGGFRDLRVLNLQNCKVACGGSLKNLRMDCCLNITDLSLSCLLSNCRYLVALDIGCCDKVTDSAFQALGTGGFESDLKVLKAGSCPRITVTGVGTILRYCKSMEYLDLRCCPNVTRLGCQQAGLRFPERCRMNFDGSLSESDAMIGVFF